MRTRDLALALAAVLLTSWSAPGAAQEGISKWPKDIREPELLVLAMAQPSTAVVSIAAAVPPSRREGLSGLFFVDGSRRIQFRPSSGEASPSDVSSPGGMAPISRLRQPAGPALVYPWLYAYDGDTHRIWKMDVREPDARPSPLDLSYSFRAPTHMAVSPHGLIAVTQGRDLVFLADGQEPVRYDRSFFPEPVGVVFSSWDTLLVLDRTRRSLVTVTLNRLKDGSIEFLSETESELPLIRETDWRSMTVLEGTAYLVSETTVYAYLEADRLLIPVLPLHPEHREVVQIALTRDELYLLDGDHLDTVPRPQPIDLSLEGSPEASQAALAGFYGYLGERNMLPTRTVLARTDTTLESLLIAENVLLAPSALASGTAIRVYDERANRKSVGQEPRGAKAQPAAGSWEWVFCELNPGLCDAATGEVRSMTVEQGRELTVPDLRIGSRLSRERILLEGQPLEWYLDRLVFSPEFRERSSNTDLIRRLNPELASRPDEEILQLASGAVVVPAEKWEVTAAVPAPDYADRDSALWQMVERFEGTSLYSRDAYVELSLRSLAAQPPEQDPDPDPDPDGDPDDEEDAAAAAAAARAAACAELKAHRKRWLETIQYPLETDSGELLWPAVAAAPVLVGILEHASTVVRTHQVFCLDRERPTWYTARNLSLTAQPEPSSFELSDQVVEDLTTFSSEAHHGTHVAALIAGRGGDCWSGLIPSAKLVLVDLTDGSAVRRAIIDAMDVGTRVFNISQEFEGPQDDLHRTVMDFQRTLFVAAAGNSSTDLDTAPAVRAPARWGGAPNVIVVAAADENGTILPQIQTAEGLREGSNFGKRYVDLVAPGENLFSASAQRKYGPATGTSQAAPQVAAAAALLVGRWTAVLDGVEYGSPQLDPGDAKARLIATADWNPDYEGEVWGGRLNLGAAVMLPEINHLRTTTGAQIGALYTFVPDNDPKIAVTNAPRLYERSGQGAIAPEKIAFSQILSLKRQPNGRYRVVFKELRTNHLKILLDAVLEDERSAVLNRPIRLECSSFKVFDPASGTFEPDDSECANGLSVTQIEEYVLGDRYQIDWEEQL